ncbi:MAG TPA: alkaline phosphatase family protein [Actinomycetota bacterium]|nr:alkaline phosphatase family protein [Actinomycetota bacterium]
MAGQTLITSPGASADTDTVSPIKHVIVIIGENHTFDNVFATYKPPPGQSVENLLSEGIVNADGSPGPNFAKAQQAYASNTVTYSIKPQITSTYATLPQPSTTSAQGLPHNVPDARFPADLPNGPFQITNYTEYQNDYVGDPIHRFYQMWQQMDEGANNLFTWTTNSAGDDNGANPPAPIYQGGVQMGFYNMQTGDAPILESLAQHYSMSDNYHQSVSGGTGANHIAIGHADDAYYQNATGTATTPPSNQIENPNPKPGTNNNYTQDGYSGGSYSECSDPSQPGVGPILSYLATQKPYKSGDCAPGDYYILNNYNPGNAPNGTAQSGPFTVPVQQNLPSIADELSARNISWSYYGEGWNNGNPLSTWCGICDPFQYDADYPKYLSAGHIGGYNNFQQQVAKGNLPAVSFVKPGSDDGHPASSTLSQFEGFAQSVITSVQDQPKLWATTAIMVTMDEGGGYYDSGYVQPISFFGDGTRIPMIVVSPYTKAGYISHEYSDHTSIDKFIERNWKLSPLSSRSWDNLPNPVAAASNPYVPTNEPAVSDLFDLFDFKHPQS